VASGVRAPDVSGDAPRKKSAWEACASPAPIFGSFHVGPLNTLLDEALLF